MYYVNTDAAPARSRTAGQFAAATAAATPARRCSARAGSCSSAATRNERDRHRHQRRHAGRHATRSMLAQRRLVTATVLADGKVLATGGSRSWNEMTGVNYEAEIWNPTTGQWPVGPHGAARAPVSLDALLLPDASVLVAGGGAPGPADNTEHARSTTRRTCSTPAACARARPRIDDRAGRSTSARRLPSTRRRAPASAASRWSRPARSRTAGTWTSASSS